MDIDIVQQNLAGARLSSAKTKVDNPEKKAMQEAKLKEACAGFEAIFLHSMLKSMRQSLPGDAVFKESNSGNIYQSMYDQYLAENLSKGSGSSIGVKEFLYEQLKDSL